MELEQVAASCPLCETPVYHPDKKKSKEEHSPAYPEKVVLPPSMRKRYTAFLVSITLLIPNLVCLFTNLLLVPESGRWFVYVNTASLMVWVLFVMPFLWKKCSAFALLAIDTLAMCVLLSFFPQGFQLPRWYYMVALPATLGLSALVLLWLLWLRVKKHEWPSIVTAVLFSVAGYSLYVDALLHYFLQNRLYVKISLLIVASCLALALFFIYARFSKRFRAYLTRKFFI